MKKILLGFTVIGLFTFIGCEKEKQKGCTEPNAINFDSAAEKNDGSCRYADDSNNNGNTSSDSTGTNNGGIGTDSTDNTVDDDITTTKIDKSELPVVITLPIDSFGNSNFSALLKGMIMSEGGSTVIDRGFCCVSLPTVDTNSNKSSNGAGTGSFNHFIDNLEGSKSYHVRAYAINSQGIKYGDAVSFTTDIAGLQGSWELISKPIKDYDYKWTFKDSMVIVESIDNKEPYDGSFDTCAIGDFFVKNGVLTIATTEDFCNYSFYAGDWDIQELDSKGLTIRQSSESGNFGAVWYEFRKIED